MTHHDPLYAGISGMNLRERESERERERVRERARERDKEIKRAE